MPVVPSIPRRAATRSCQRVRVESEDTRYAYHPVTYHDTPSTIPKPNRHDPNLKPSTTRTPCVGDNRLCANDGSPVSQTPTGDSNHPRVSSVTGYPLLVPVPQSGIPDTLDGSPKTTAVTICGGGQDEQRTRSVDDCRRSATPRKASGRAQHVR